MTQTETPRVDPTSLSAGRWTGFGTSQANDSFEAGAEATHAADGGRHARLYVVFATTGQDVEAFLAGAASQVGPDAIVIGTTTDHAMIDGAAAADRSLVVAVGGDDVSVAIRSSEIIDGDIGTASEHVAGALLETEDRGNSMMIVLSDAEVVCRDALTAGLNAIAGDSVPMVGFCAGGEGGWQSLFHANRDGTWIGRDQVVGVALASTKPFELGLGDSSGPQADAARASLSFSARSVEAGITSLGAFARAPGESAFATETNATVFLG